MACDGGPAFPRAPAEHEQGQVTQDGMSLRDYFAAKALQGLLACPELTGSEQGFAERAYGYADAMLAERAKGRQP